GIRALEIDEASRRVRFKQSSKSEPLPEKIAIGLAGPIDSSALRRALFRFADSVLEGKSRYRAVISLLKRETPRLKDARPGDPIVVDGGSLAEMIDAICRLEESCIIVQGP